jgi:uncharacterized protein YwqG
MVRDRGAWHDVRVPSAFEFAAAARAHLPAEMANTWLSLLRPAVRLTAAADPSESPAGHLGGTPLLPVDLPWPSWDGHGPLTYVAGLDCAQLPSRVAIPGLPTDGQLLFFYFDGQCDDGQALVLPGEPDGQSGARVLHIDAAQPVQARSTPDGLEPYPRVPLTAQVTITAPSYDHPVLHDTFGAEFSHTAARHPLRDNTFCTAIGLNDDQPLHQLGGYAWPVQGDVEYEVATVDDSHPREWILLAQFDSDDTADMLWGDRGILYWMIRPEDLVARRFDRAAFTWQCC